MIPSTFSIAARDAATGEYGVAVQSKFLAVGSVVPWVASDAGAIATQAWANPAYGPDGLARLRAGASAQETLDALIAADDGRDDRQVGIVDLDGRAATYTGAACTGAATGTTGPNFAVQGNCLAGDDVVHAMAAAFERTRGALAGRLVAALDAGQRAGGDKRGQQSAALTIARAGAGYGGFSDRYVDLRVDDHPAPIGELARLLDLHRLYLVAAEPDEVVDIDTATGDEIVRILIREGRLGEAHPGYDAAAAAALTAFMHTENLENRCRDDGRIDLTTLGYLRGKRP